MTLLTDPLLSVDLDVIAQNTQVAVDLCRASGVLVTGITKATRGNRRVAAAMIEGGVSSLGDSRIANLAGLEGLGVPRWLIRAPLPAQAPSVVRHAEGSLNSEPATIRALSAAAHEQGRVHRVVLMVDAGDRREGIADLDHLLCVAELTESLDGVELAGVGTNMTCFAFVQPSTAAYLLLLEAAHAIEDRIGRSLDMVSAGNSAAMNLLRDGGVPDGITHYRLGEALLFGKERATYTFLPGTRRDGFVLSAGIIEVQTKASMPTGEIGTDSYGRRPQFADKGVRRRAVVAVGRQDIDTDTMRPVDPLCTVEGASSDHLIIDVTDAAHDYQVGDRLELELGYFATMRATTSPYVHLRYRGGL